MSDTIGVEDTSSAAASGESAAEVLDRRVAADAKPMAFAEDEGEEGKGEREFAYSWPRQVSAIPALAARLDAERQLRLDEQKTQWAEAIEDCPEEYVACRNNLYELEWQVVADTPRFLSLSASFATYTGGAHGLYGRDSTVWDREAEEALSALQLFTSTPALEEALGEVACDALNAERGERRGAPVVPDPDDWSSACVPMADAVLFLGSSTGARFDRIGVYYGPYVAGAYAEGDFEFTFPVTPALLNAVKPDYRVAFSVADGEGS